MATNIKTLTESNGDILIPRTTSTAVTLTGGTVSLDTKLNDIDSVLSNKVDKVTGKILSTNDYTTIEKNKVSNIPTNTNTELGNKVDKVTGKGLSTNDYTTPEKSKVTNLPENTTQEIGTISAQLAEKALKTETGILANLLTTAKTSIVNAINELFNSKANKVQESWQSPTLLNGWTGDIKYRKQDDGIVIIKFTNVTVPATAVYNQEIFSLPAGYYSPAFTAAMFLIDVNGSGKPTESLKILSSTCRVSSLRVGAIISGCGFLVTG